jgi:hypothetical protein
MPSKIYIIGKENDAFILDKVEKTVTCYSGTICSRGVSFFQKGKFITRTGFKSKEQLQELRRVLSDEMGLTAVRPATLLELGEVPTMHLQQYMAGFFDGLYVPFCCDFC